MVYPIFRFWVYSLRNLMIRKIKGEENIPDKNSFIIVSNHEHLIDPFYILYPVLRRLKKKVHFIATPSWWFLGDKVCREWAGCIPLFNPEQAYKDSRQLIKSGEIVAIFPEGGIGRTKNPKTGAVRLALETKVPILPIGIKSSYIPFNSKLNIGNIIYLKKSKNIKEQAKSAMNQVYKLRREII